MTTDIRRRTASSTPSLASVVAYWRDLQDVADVFPRLDALRVGWSEPSCFKCGWLAPVPAGRSWLPARGWLEVAHLADWALTGASEPADCVPLCILCHKSMPSFATREEAVRWVSSGRRPEPGWQMWTDAVFGDFYGEGFLDVPAKREAIRDTHQRFQQAVDEHAA